MNRKKRMSLRFLLTVLAVCCSGCSGSGTEVDLGAVSGVVTMDGKPLGDVIVIFAPTEGRNPSSGRTDADGTYELVYLGKAKGAIIGGHKVRIITGEPVDSGTDGNSDIIKEGVTGPVDTAGSALEGVNNKSGKVKKETIPAKYNSQTELKADVKAGGNTINFDLVSK